jgi:hypothetical protein
MWQRFRANFWPRHAEVEPDSTLERPGAPPGGGEHR